MGQLLVLLGLAATATALPAYVHEEIPAEPYIHEEIPAEPYVHIEPPIDDLTLGIIRPNQQQGLPATPAAGVPAAPAVLPAAPAARWIRERPLGWQVRQQPRAGSGVQEAVLRREEKSEGRVLTMLKYWPGSRAIMCWLPLCG